MELPVPVVVTRDVAVVHADTLGDRVGSDDHVGTAVAVDVQVPNDVYV